MSTNEQVSKDARQLPMRQEIVVGIDESRASAAALRWAADHSHATGLPLRLVRAWQISAAASTAVTSGAGQYLEAAAADARARATRWVLDTLGGDAARVRWTLEVHEGGAGPVLVAVSHGARLVVVGTHEHTGLRRAVSGSVSHYVLSHADGPVVAVPAPVEQALDDGGRNVTVMGPMY
ncbi:MAG TPA: universal stress protein [Actinomycetes bacterium]